MTNSLIASLVADLLQIPCRLQATVTAYLLALMLDGPKKTLSHAATVSGIHKSQFSRLLGEHPDLAIASLKMLAADAAKQAGVERKPFVRGAAWSIAIIIDATLHPRSSLHVANAQRFNHGQGFIIGHQWTNVVIFVNGMWRLFAQKNPLGRVGAILRVQIQTLASELSFGCIESGGESRFFIAPLKISLACSISECRISMR